MNDTERLDVLERILTEQKVERYVKPELHGQLGFCLFPWDKGIRIGPNLSNAPCKTVREAIDAFVARQ